MLDKKIRLAGRCSVLALILLFLLPGCAGKDNTVYRGATYPPTASVIPSFQPGQVPVSCSVFSHLLIWLPRDANGKTIAREVEKKAREHGADMVLIGGSRQAEDDNDLLFTYYGPEQQYLCRDKWCGWKFGYDIWADQGDWVTLGFNEWGNEDVSFDFPIIMQAAFLRCQDK